MVWNAIKKRREARVIQLSVFRSDFTPDPVGEVSNRTGFSKKMVKCWLRCVRRFWLQTLHEVLSGNSFLT